jgi:hypothetical protein
MAKKLFAGVVVLVGLCLVAVYAPSQDPSGVNRQPPDPQLPPVLAGAPDAPPTPSAAELLRQKVSRLAEVRRQIKALERQEAELVAEIRAAVANQRADLDRIERLLSEPPGKAGGEAKGFAPKFEKKTATEKGK